MHELNCVIKVTYVIAGVITIFLFLNDEAHSRGLRSGSESAGLGSHY